MGNHKGKMVLGSSALLVVAVWADSSRGSRATPDYAGVCRDPQTQQRVPDSDCEFHSALHPGASWVYYRAGSRVAPVGEKLTGPYSPTAPTGKTYTNGGYTSKGGVVTGSGFTDGTTVQGKGGAKVGSITRGGFGVKGGFGGRGGFGG